MERKQPKCVEIGPGPCLACADAQATIAALQARVQELEEITKVICGHCCEPMEIPSKAVLQSALTQRTAELEAAQQERDRSDREADQTLAKWSDVSTQLDVAQAELERVRGLIKALPKVEGEISERFCTGSYYSSPYDYRSHVTFETALVALLKHRQGMEG